MKKTRIEIDAEDVEIYINYETQLDLLCKIEVAKHILEELATKALKEINTGIIADAEAS